MILYDAIDVTKPRMTRDGFLTAQAHVARTGIQNYYARELGLTDGDPDRVVRVYRPAEEVFSADAMASYAFRPVTVDHPGDLVTADNWKEFARGQTGGEVLRDGEFVRVPLVLMDAAAIREWKAGKRQLSMGYEMQLDMTAGVTDSGEAFDAVQRNLRMNHLALVSQARGGSRLKLGDENLEESSMDVKLTTVTVDGLSVQTTDAGAQAISKLSTELADAQKAFRAAEVKMNMRLAAKDQELAEKDAELDDLKTRVLTDAALDAKVNERADLIAKAKSVADKDYTGKSVDEIRRTAVAARLGSNAVTDKSPEYIAARFDILVEDAHQDPVRRTLRAGDVQATGDAAETAHAGMVSHLQNAWKGGEVA